MTSTATPARPAIDEQRLSDRLEIIEVTNRMGLLVDARQWDALAGLFTDPVEVDYTSLNGGEPATVSPDTLIGGWRTVLDQIEATQHLISGQTITIDKDQATCAASVQGTHVLRNPSGGPHWTVGGRYDFRLTHTDAGWRISGLTLIVQWASGNQHIMTLAAG